MRTATPLRALIRASLLAAVACVTSSALLAADSAPPEHMTYQGYLVDGNGLPLGSDTPKNYDVVFRIGDDGSNVYWSEYQTVTVDKGYFSVLLGEGTQVASEPRPPLSSVFNGENANKRFIGFTVKGIGTGTAPDVEIKPRVQLLSSPYSFLAHNAVNAANLIDETGQETVSVIDRSVGINTATPTAALDVNGSVNSSGGLTAETVALGSLGHPGWGGIANKSASSPTTYALLQNDSGTQTRINAKSGDSSRLAFVFDNGADAMAVTPNGYVTATRFVGSLWAAHLDGTIADGVLSHNVALLDGGQSFTKAPVFSAGFYMGNNVVANDHHIWLRGDSNHGIGYNFAADGPTVYGYQGGVLQTTLNGVRDVLVWRSNGRVGIGTDSPGRRLHVKGDTDTQVMFERAGVGSTWTIGTDFNGHFAFYPSGGQPSYINRNDGNYYVGSDAQLKQDVLDIANPLEKALQLRPVSYHFKASPDAERSLGFIAQEVEGILPEVTAEKDGIKSVSYSAIIPVAVGAIQQLHAESERKQQEIDNLKLELQELRAAVAKLAANNNTASSR